MAKIKNDYFKLIEQQTYYCVQASTLLSEILCNYTASSIPNQRDKIHKFEQAADELGHDILTHLSVEFITPIDREDILHLVQLIYNITCALDKVILEFYMFNITETPTFVPSISKVVDRCVKVFYEAVKELKNFKKPTALHKLLVDVSSIKCKADAIYIDAIHNLFANEKNSARIIAHKSIYESLVDCCSQCKFSADVIAQIVVKNT